MKLLLLFLLMSLLGGVGGAVGSMLGNALGRGGVFVGGIVGGVLFVVAGAFLTTRWGWIRQQQRVWMLLGALLGLGLAVLVTLTTLQSPFGPILSTLLIGMGAVLGAQIGKSAHDRMDE